MQLWVFLLLLLMSGWLTYRVIAKQVKGLTRTPVWQLWLMLMAPILLLTLWRILSGGQMLNPLVFCVLLVLSFVGYANLIQRGRIRPSQDQAEQPLQPIEPVAETPTEAVTLSEEATGTEETASNVRPLNAEEEVQLRECFPWSVYFVQNLEYRPQAVICWGQLRAKAEDAYQQIQTNIQQAFGDRFLVLLQEGQNRKPVFAIVTNPQVTPEGEVIRKTLDRPGWGIGLALLSFLTTTWAGYEMVRLLPQPLKPTQPTR